MSEPFHGHKSKSEVLNAFGFNIRIMLPAAVTNGALSMFEEHNEPGAGPPLHVNGLVATPTLARNEPGYDQASKLYLSFETGAFGDIPFKPSKEDARSALDELFAA